MSLTEEQAILYKNFSAVATGEHSEGDTIIPQMLLHPDDVLNLVQNIGLNLSNCLTIGQVMDATLKTSIVTNTPLTKNNVANYKEDENVREYIDLEALYAFNKKLKKPEIRPNSINWNISQFPVEWRYIAGQDSNNDPIVWLNFSLPIPFGYKLLSENYNISGITLTEHGALPTDNDYYISPDLSNCSITFKNCPALVSFKILLPTSDMIDFSDGQLWPSKTSGFLTFSNNSYIILTKENYNNQYN